MTTNPGSAQDASGESAATAKDSTFAGSAGAWLIGIAGVILLAVIGTVTTLAWRQRRTRTTRPVGYLRH
jgi:heme/copper-type cytochrome/quinol oxidase subunit 2